eukprot:3194667-Rhodomonas_salina.1
MRCAELRTELRLGDCTERAYARNPTQEPANSVQFVREMWFLVFDFGAYGRPDLGPVSVCDVCGAEPERIGVRTEPESLGVRTEPERLGVRTEPERLGVRTEPERLGGLALVHMKEEDFEGAEKGYVAMKQDFGDSDPGQPHYCPPISSYAFPIECPVLT